MKKKMFLVLMAFATLAMVGCKKDNNDLNVPNGTEFTQISCYHNNWGRTRMFPDGNHEFHYDIQVIDTNRLNAYIYYTNESSYQTSYWEGEFDFSNSTVDAMPGDSLRYLFNSENRTLSAEVFYHAFNIEWVDLGLPSGVQWANCNYGAYAPEGYGKHYAWGEIETKRVYDWITYKYATTNEEGKLSQLTKYNTNPSYGDVDNLTTLEAMDDIAATDLGDGTRIPTADDWNELTNNTTSAWTTLNGVNGIRFTASNGNSIFLPAAGYHEGSENKNVGNGGTYWSSSLNQESHSENAWALGFFALGHTMSLSNRYLGFSIRPVHQD